jgi:cell division protein ZapA (FtsZ GTPase activity inhibitor)
MTNPDQQTRGTIVQIFGDEYHIASQSDPAEVQRIGQYVDEKMRSIAQQHSGRVPKATLAVLAAMEITGELFGAMNEQSQLTDTAQENLDRLNRLVDARADMFSSLLERSTQTYNRRLHDEPARNPAPTPTE